MNQCYNEITNGDSASLKAAARYQEYLERNDFYSIETKIHQVATGLGLTAIGLDRSINKISGGQRAKVILAKLLLEKPDVLLLDEPTNFLDSEHIEWLAGYLTSLENAFMVVCHDHNFLEKIATHICDIDNGKIRKYSGTYSEYSKKKAHLQDDYVKQYTAQQKEIKKTEEFIRKNIAGRKTKMARGRRTKLNRMDRLEPLGKKEKAPLFTFQCLPCTASSQLKVRNLSVGYESPILTGISLSMKGGQRVAVTGFNGVGKSTLLKTLLQQIPAIEGEFSFSSQAQIGYFEQDLQWEDDHLTPIAILSEHYPMLTKKEVRKQLARCGISNEHAMQEVGTLSGGEQSKLKLCLLMLKPCNFLIMDEPTNHLDQLAKESLKDALINFEGTVLLVSHEKSFLQDVVTKVINVEKNS